MGVTALRATRTGGCLLVALTLGYSVPGHARSGNGPASEPATAQPGRVLVGAPSGSEDLPADTLKSVLDGYFVGTGLSSSVIELSPDDDILDRIEWASAISEGEPVHAVFWLSPVEDQGLRLFLLHPPSQKIWSREVPMTSDPDVMIENLGVMVRASALALRDGAPAGMEAFSPPDQPPDPAQDPMPGTEEPTVGTTSDPQRKRPEIVVYVGYLGSSLASDIRWQNGVGGKFGVVHHSGAFVLIGGSWLAPSTIDDLVELRVQRVPLDARAGYRFLRRRKVRPEVDLTVIADLMSWDAADQGDVEAKDGLQWRFAVAPGIGMSWQIHRGLGLALHAELDLWLVNADLVVQTPTGRASQVRPHTVGGAVNAGLYYGF